MTSFNIIFTPSGIKGTVKEGIDVLSASRQLGVDLASVCGGNGQCSRCKIQLIVGNFAKHQINSGESHLSPLTLAEKEIINTSELKQSYRLSCQAKILGDVVIDIPAQSQIHEQVVCKAATEISIEPNPAVELIQVEVEEADMYLASGDLERLKDAIEFETGLQNLAIEATILRQLQTALRKGKWIVTVAIYEKIKIIAIWAGVQKRAYGLAVDIGSTTIAGHLCDLATAEVIASHGLMNPQIRFGEDVMSRVSYSMMNNGGDKEMTDVVRAGICELTDHLIAATKIKRDQVLDAVFVANPIMHHLFLGINPVELGGAPFALAIQSSLTLSASSLNLNMASGARIYIPPCIAGHVGADAASVALAELPYISDEIMLIIDVGTNAEIILGNKEKLVAASSPTGPAFEGAQIESGQRAAPGAIERVRINRKTLEARFKVIGCELWSDEVGFDNAIQKSGVTGICGSGIIEAIATMFLAGIIQSNGVIDGSKSKVSQRIFKNDKTWAYQLYKSAEINIFITQKDVRAIQLAKATLYASIQLLMDKVGIKKNGIKEIEQIRFAGAFGAHIDPKYAMILGMIPDCKLNNVKSVGNAAGTGARIALTSQSARREIEQQVLKMEKIETAIEPDFQEYFVNAMAIPHKTDHFENLSQIVEFPVATELSDSPRVTRRRRSSRGGSPNKSR